VCLLQRSEEAEALSVRARADVVEKRDMRRMTERLVESYRTEVERMRSRSASDSSRSGPQAGRSQAPG
jgi:hypothetical protein